MGWLSDVSDRINVSRPVLVNESLVSWRTVKAVLIIIEDCAMSLDLPALVRSEVPLFSLRVAEYDSSLPPPAGVLIPFLKEGF